MTLDDFKTIHVGKRAYIIGKGPTLDRIEERLDQDEFHGQVVFCINESIHRIEALPKNFFANTSLYCVQQDSELESDCNPTLPTTVHFMNAVQHQPLPKGQERPLFLTKRKVSISPWDLNAVLYDFPENYLTALATMHLCRHMGIKHLVFCCFDSWAKEPNCEYAKCIGKDSGALAPADRHRPNGAWVKEVAARDFEKVETMLPFVGDIK